MIKEHLGQDVRISMHVIERDNKFIVLSDAYLVVAEYTDGRKTKHKTPIFYDKTYLNKDDAEADFTRLTEQHG